MTFKREERHQPSVRRIVFSVTLLVAFALLGAGPSGAHEVWPGYLEIRQTAVETYEVLWKVPARGDMRLGIQARLPGISRPARPP